MAVVTDNIPGHREGTAPRRLEAERLLGALDCLDDGVGRVIAVSGDPGTGKSTLLNEAAREATRRGVTVLSGQPGPTGHGTRCGVLVSALLSRPAAGPGNPRPEELHEVARTLATGPFPRGADAGPGPDDACRFYSWFAETLNGWAGEGLLLQLDDMHMADEGTLQILEYLLRWPPQGPVSVMLAYRPRQAAPALGSALASAAGFDTVEHVELGPLSLGEAGGLLGLAPDSPRLFELYRASGANPLHLVALAAQRSDGADPHEPGALPAVFAARMLGEIAPLADTERGVLESCAVLSGNFESGMVAAVAEVTQEVACTSLAELYRLDLLRMAAGRQGLEFRSPLLRQVVYERSDACWRIGAHRRAYQAFAAAGAGPAELAGQLERTTAGTVAGDAAALCDAAGEALRVGDHRVAARWTRLLVRILAADCVEPPEERAALVAGARGLASRLAAQTGDRGLAAEAEARLTRFEADPEEDPAAAPSPLAVLTVREREVADLVITGETSREIARKLAVSPRTVEVHLSRTYRKLGVRSRTALAWVMAESG